MKFKIKKKLKIFSFIDIQMGHVDKVNGIEFIFLGLYSDANTGRLCGGNMERSTFGFNRNILLWNINAFNSNCQFTWRLDSSLYMPSGNGSLSRLSFALDANSTCKVGATQ